MTRERDLDEHDRLLLQLVRIAARIRLTLAALKSPDGTMARDYGVIDVDGILQAVDGHPKASTRDAAFYAYGYCHARLEATLDDLDALLPPKEEVDALEVE